MPRLLEVTASSGDSPGRDACSLGGDSNEPEGVHALPQSAAHARLLRRRPSSAGPTHSLQGVLPALERIRVTKHPEAIHLLRVTLRRCRVVAAVMRTVDPHPAWRSVRRRSRKLFRALGALRDVQVLEKSVAAVTTANGPLRWELVVGLRARERAAWARVDDAIEAFDRVAWKRLVRRVSRRARLVRPDGAVAQYLGLERYLDVCRLHSRAVRTQAPRPWHEARIAVKRLRYVVECFLPARYAVWGRSLKEIQDVLGKLHDLDVLRAYADDVTNGDAATMLTLCKTIDLERQQCMDEYRRRTGGPGSMLRQWRAGLPRGFRIDAVIAARFRATARALDPSLQRTIAVSRIALQLFTAIAASVADRRFRDGKGRAILRGAARLHHVRVRRKRRSPQQAASETVRDLPPPIGWRSEDWDVLALTVRYHRGSEPNPTRGAFASLPPERQQRVCVLAGVLRLARALHKSGATAIATEPHSDVRLRVAGIVDSRKNAARIAGAKHLLDLTLRRDVVILHA